MVKYEINVKFKDEGESLHEVLVKSLKISLLKKMDNNYEAASFLNDDVKESNFFKHE